MGGVRSHPFFPSWMVLELRTLGLEMWRLAEPMSLSFFPMMEYTMP
jgi:hypothetical protein